jgi:hypothetical protein
MRETKDWRKICAACQEGEPPEDCEYFGEPGGCNAKTIGKHPNCDKSSQVGNAAAMYEALKAVVKVGYPHNFQHEAPHIRGYCYEITTAIDKCFAALATPPRNCDIMSYYTARKVWFTKEILPRLNGDLPLGQEVPFEEWFVSQHEKGKSK